MLRSPLGGMWLALLSLALPTALAGCGSALNKSRFGASSSHSQTSSKSSLQRTWHALTKNEPTKHPRWDWASGVPIGGVRAETVLPTIPGEVLADLVPQFRQQQVLLTSTHSADENYRIANINGQEVRTCADVLAAAANTEGAPGHVQIDLVDARAGPNSPREAIVVEQEQLVALTHAATLQQPVMRVAEGGNPWLVIQQTGVRCGLMTRVEREHGMLQVVLSLENCGGPDRLLPAEVRAQCDGAALRCLTVAETLEVLYGDGVLEGGNDARNSFAAVSEGDDYLMPTNYNRLHQQMMAANSKATARAPSALASIAGEVYPGPPVLGDARALTGIMLQPTLCRCGLPEHTGWIMFGGKSLRDGGTVTIEMDLGNGPQEFRFTIPAP